MKDHSNTRRAFVFSSRAWYAGDMFRDGDEIMFGMYAGEGGTSGEMGMHWISLGGKNVPQLQVYDDAWNALSLFGDLIQALGEFDGENITPEMFIEILKSCGFVDITQYTDPSGKSNRDYLLSELQATEDKARKLRQRLSAA